METSNNTAYVMTLVNENVFQKNVTLHPDTISVEKARAILEKQGALVAKSLSMQEQSSFAAAMERIPDQYFFQLRYFDHIMIGDEKAASTRSNYKNYVGRYMTWNNWFTQGDTLLNVTTDHLRLYRSTVLSGIKNTTVNQQMSAVNQFFEDVCSMHIKLNSMNTEMFMPLVPSREQVRKMFQGCCTPVGKLIMILLSQCGLRVRELIELHPSDFHFDGGASGSIPYVYVRPMKTHRDRWVWLPDIGVKAYRDYINSFGKGHAPKGEDFLFPGRKPGMPLSEATVENRLALMQENLGWEGPFFTPHSLRHYFGRSLYLNGLTAEEIAQMMGHSKISSTYVYMRSAVLDVTLQKLADMKGKPPVSEFGLKVRSAYRDSPINL